MVIVLQKGIPEKEKQDLKSFLIRNNFKVNEITGSCEMSTVDSNLYCQKYTDECFIHLFKC